MPAHLTGARLARNGSTYQFVAASLCVALAAAAVSALGVPLGRYSPYLDLLGQFAPQAGLGAAVIGIVYALMRLRVMAGLALGTALLALVVVQPRAEIAACAPATPTHRIAFLNVWNGNRHIDATFDYLKSLNPDVIVLVELRPPFMGAVKQLGADYPYQSACQGDCTALVLSRRPLTEITAELNHGEGPRSLAAAEIPYTDGTLTLIGVHLYRPWPYNRPMVQVTEAASLAHVLAPLAEPRLVLGDFNATPWGAVTQAVARGAALTPLTGVGTWRTNFPALFRIPIDQALAGSGISCANRRVGARVGSDHRPVIVDFAFAK